MTRAGAGIGRTGDAGGRCIPANIRPSRGGRTKPAARRDRAVRMTRAAARRATRRARHALAPCQYPPFPRSAGKTGGGQNPRRAGIGRTGNAGGGAHETRTDKTRRRAARRGRAALEMRAGGVRPHGERGRAGAGRRGTQNRRQAGIGLRSGCGRARRATRRTEPAARRVRPRGGRGRARRVTRRARYALAHFQYPPFPRRTGKTRGAQG